jgi:PAS domain S-box-containing protein
VTAEELRGEVEDRKQAEEALDNERLRLEAMMQALPVGMAITDATGGIVQSNGAFDEVWGGPRPKTESVNDYATYNAWWADNGQLVKPEEWASAQAVKSGVAVVGQLLKIQRFDGSFRFVINSAAPVRGADGRVVGSAVAIQDITALKQAEEAATAAEESKHQFYLRTILAATDGKLVITEKSVADQVGGTVIGTWRISEPSDVGSVRRSIEAAAMSAGMEEPRLGQLAVAVGEAATNAYRHAGQGEAFLYRSQNAVTVVISDRGPGIPALSMPDVALRRGYSTAGTLGMGYKVMISYADRVFLATGPEGTTVALEMKLHPEKRLMEPWAAMIGLEEETHER